ncbi:CHAD domain-containing protein [Streptomyces sp. NPDC088725]|uniref:CYTH and CHAD domain-containing protein n=1 Tax=Streptomyces sp. NPDC088725 TaxID=3365873 RepID=UPI0037F96034
MANTKREIERKYELPEWPDANQHGLPDLTRVGGVASICDKGVVELDAVYYDTPDLRLASDSLTLRRRTGGGDEGWHLKLPVAAGIRDEIQAPLADAVPDELAALLRSRVRGAELAPVIRLLTSRDVSHLADTEGELLAEVSVDTVHAQRLTGGSVRLATWTEVEVELAEGGDPALLDTVEKKFRKAGLRPAAAASKLARALEETAPKRRRDGKGPGKKAAGKVRAGKKSAGKANVGKKNAHKKHAAKKASASTVRHEPVTAGDHVLAYLRKQADAIVAHDPAVRRDLPDAVHQMRVATRRMRSAFRSYRAVLDRTVTDPIGEELKWLAGELGVDRDQEVLEHRLTAATDAVPGTLLLGPVRARLQIWTLTERVDSRNRTLALLDSPRYLALLDTIDALLANPPLRKAADRDAAGVLPRAVLKDYHRLAGRIEHAQTLAPGETRDLALHDARKAAKRARYAADAARPALGGSAKRLARRMKALQTVLGDHQDSVVARETLRTLAVHAHAAGETAFTWGLLYGQEEARADERERELPQVWAEASDPRLLSALTR